MPAGMLHILRATLLYDTLAARLDNKIVFYDEFRRYEKFAAKRARRRFNRGLRRTFRSGIDDRYYLRLEQIIDTANRAMFRLQSFLNIQPLRYLSMVSKSIFVIMAVMKLIGFTILITGLPIIVVAGIKFITGQEINFLDIFTQVVSNRWYQCLFVIAMIVNIRQIFYRLSDRDIN